MTGQEGTFRWALLVLQLLAPKGERTLGPWRYLAAFAPSEVSAQDSGQDAFRPLTQAMLNDPDPADWLMWRGGYANWGYSPLDQITRDKRERDAAGLVLGVCAGRSRIHGNAGRADCL